MQVPNNIPLHQRDWHALSLEGREIVAKMAEEAGKATVAEPMSLKEAVAAAGDEEIEALPYIGPSHVKRVREWADED
jgi:hypothetical protein